MVKIYYSWQQIQGACLDIAKQLQLDNWYPDYIVGITRGGLMPATLLSQFLEKPMHALNVSLRDANFSESNLWMAEDAVADLKILVVDDINDSGATISWIKDDWQKSYNVDTDKWDTIWSNNVRFAVITNNMASNETVDYSVFEVNKAENDCWLVYPWEQFWLSHQ